MFARLGSKVMAGVGGGLLFGAGTSIAAEQAEVAIPQEVDDAPIAAQQQQHSLNEDAGDVECRDEEPADYDLTWGTTWNPLWDNPRGRNFPQEGKGIRQVLLIRHGQYQNEGSDDDSIRTLTNLGEEQARFTGRYLRDNLDSKSQLFVAKEVEKVTSSNLTRAKQTARLIVDEMNNNSNSLPLYGKKIEEDSMLRERKPCDPQPPHGRKATEDTQRKSEAAFQKYMHRPVEKDNKTTELIVGHANIIRYFACRGLQLPPEAWLRISLCHCSITSLKFRSNGNVSIGALGSVTHLPGKMQTTMNVE